MTSISQVRVAALLGLVILAGAVGFGLYAQSAHLMLRSAVSGTSSAPRSAASLPIGPTAADFTGIQGWENSPPLDMHDLRGRVVLVDFWTYSCINCQRTLPFLRRWWDTYHSQGLVIVGVHSPEFDFEKNPDNVRRAIAEYNVTWPVALDSQMRTWDAYGNQYWPAEYLVDQQGRIRREHFGEGEYDVTEAAIRALLRAAAPAAAAPPDQTPQQELTGEAYVGTDRSDGRIRLGPGWTVHEDSATAASTGAWAEIQVHAARTFVVAASPSGDPVRLYITVDGRTPAPGGQPTNVGQDAGGAFVTVAGADLYPVLALRQVEDHTLRVTSSGPLQLFTFTFGA